MYFSYFLAWRCVSVLQLYLILTNVSQYAYKKECIEWQQRDWKASLAKWLSVRLRTKWLWVRISLLSLKLQIWRLLRARSSLIFMQTIECEFTLKLVRDMIITYSQECIACKKLRNRKEICSFSFYYQVQDKSRVGRNDLNKKTCFATIDYNPPLSPVISRGE